MIGALQKKADAGALEQYTRGPAGVLQGGQGDRRRYRSDRRFFSSSALYAKPCSLPALQAFVLE